MATISNLVDKACLDAELAKLRAECCKTFTDCKNNVLADGAKIASCQDVTDKITLAMQTTARDCNGSVLDLTSKQIPTCQQVDSKITSAINALRLTNCAGAQVPLSTPVPTCTEMNAAIAAIKVNTCTQNQVALSAQTLATCNEVDSKISAIKLTNCQNQQIALSTPVATCADITALQQLITNLTNRVSVLEAKLSKPQDIVDCAGTVLGTVYTV